MGRFYIPLQVWGRVLDSTCDVHIVHLAQYTSYCYLCTPRTIGITWSLMGMQISEILRTQNQIFKK